MNKRCYLRYKNDINIANWYMRRALNGGESYKDLRDEASMQRFRLTQIKVWQAKRTLSQTAAKHESPVQRLLNKFLPGLLRPQALRP